MPAKSLDPLKKVTVDLFARDVEFIQNRAENFSEVLRTLLHNHVAELRVIASHNEMRRSLKDLPHGR